MPKPLLFDRWAPDTIGHYVGDALGRLDHGIQRGVRQPEAEKKIHKGAHPCPRLEVTLRAHAAAGTPVEQALAVWSAGAFATRLLYNAIPDATDLLGALHREQRAQCGVDPIQMRLFATGQYTEADAELCLTRLEEQREATEALMLAIRVDLLRRSEARRLAQRQLMPRSA